MKKGRVVWCDRGWQPVWFGFCPSRKAWKRQMKRMGLKGEPYPETDGRCTTFDRKGKTVVLITLRDGAENERPASEILGVLIHEAVHVWQEVRACIGEHEPSKEFEAYSVQAISQSLIEAFEKTRGKAA